MIETLIYSVLTMAVVGGFFAAALLVADRFLADYGVCTLNVNDREELTVEGGCTVLDALYDNGIFLPSGCGGQGTCGHCTVEVLSGGGPVLPTELPLLTREQIDRGVRLACQVKIKEDTEVRIKEEYFNIQQFEAVVTAARMLTHDMRQLRLRLVEPDVIEFRPGQYVQVQVPTPDGPVHRAYSISSPPEEGHEIELIVRLIPGGVGSTYLHSVQVGDAVRFTGPYGEFVLSEDPRTEIVCVAGGCGIAPAKSILEHVQQASPERPFSLFFGVRTRADVFFKEEFDKLSDEYPNFHVYYALSEPGRAPDWDGETGFIHRSVEKHLDAERPRQAFLCGPEPMIDATEQVLKSRGVPEEDIYYDSW